MTPIRVLHCPTMTGGHPGQLARAERRLGLASIAVSLYVEPAAYETDEVVWRPGDGLARREFRRWRLIHRALRDFDVIHFNFGSSLMPRRVPLMPGEELRVSPPLQVVARIYARLVELRDLPLLHRAGKGIVVTYQGTDARQGDVTRDRYELSLASVPGYFGDREDEGKRRSIAIFDRYADHIFALNPDLLAMLPDRAEFLPYAHVDPDAWIPSYREPGEVVRVVHAPTRRGVKGTQYVIDAVERLQAENVPLTLELIEGLTHAEAQRLYEGADIVVDQLLAGWYGGFAVEAMALGKPVISYLRDDDLARVPAEMRVDLPVISATPDTIADVLRRLATSERLLLHELGRRGRAYVERWHDPRTVAARVKGVYEEIMASRR